jgi:transcriptional regulator CtsR
MEIKIDEIELGYAVNYFKRVIHVISNNADKEKFKNIIGRSFQRKLIYKRKLLQEVLYFEWLLYGTDGSILSFKYNRLCEVSPDDKRLYEPFLRQIKGNVK